jgi:hypothetical protein
MTYLNTFLAQFVTITFPNVGLSTFLQSIMVTKKSTEIIQETEAIKFVVLICNPRTYNLPLSEDRLHHLHSVTKVKTE